jgi:hypothetical protein
MRRYLFGLAGAAVLLAAAPAQAQKVYINGQDCTGIINVRFEGATVSFDAQGNIRIDAPGYRVQVIQPGSTATPPSTGTTTATTTTTSGTGSAAGTQTVVYSDSGRAMTTGPAGYNPPIYEQTTTTVVTTSAGSSGTSTTRPATTATTRPTTTGTTTTGTTTTTPRTGTTSALTKQYFLITQGTGGAAVAETIQVNINGRQVRQVDSAGAQVIDNVNEYLSLGSNQITMMSTKKTSYVTGASSSTFQVIIGEGHVEHGGQVVIDMPLITYTRTAADSTAASRSYTLDAR